MDRTGTELASKPSFTVSLSDILGYIVPGGTLWLSALFFEIRATAIATGPGPYPRTDLLTAMSTPALNTFRLLHADLNSLNLVVAVAFALALLVGFYVTGHVVASFSSLLVDRILVFKGLGYPYETLLRLEDDGYTPFSEPTSWFVRGAFIWSLFYLVCRYLEFAFQYLHKSQIARICDRLADWTLVPFAVAILTQIALGVTRRSLVSELKQQVLASKGYKARSLAITPRLEADIQREAEDRLTRRPLPEWTAYAFWLLEWLWALPYDAVAPLIADPLNTRRAFNTAFIAQYRAAFNKRFGLASQDAATNNFWLSYCHVAEQSPRLAASAHNWLNLYGFSRNLATAFFLAFIYSLLWLAIHSDLVPGWPAIGPSWPMTGLVFLGMSLILLLRYYYLYVCYFSKFIFRAFVYLEGGNTDSAAGTPERTTP